MVRPRYAPHPLAEYFSWSAIERPKAASSAPAQSMSSQSDWNVKTGAWTAMYMR